MGQMIDLEAIEARAAAATPGPWEKEEWFYRNGILEAGDGTTICTVRHRGGQVGPNGEFIAHARQDIPDLIARIRELEAQLANFQGSPGK